MIGVQRVQEADQLLPGAALDRLPAIVAETKVYRAHHLDLVEDPVNGSRRQRSVVRIPADLGFIHLHTRAIQPAHLRREPVRNRVRTDGGSEDARLRAYEVPMLFG